MSRIPTGWRVVIAYSLVAGATQMLWLTYAAITTDTARRYGVSEGAVGWLAEIFPLLYVLLAIPAGMLLDRWFLPTLRIGGLLVGAGGLLRLGGQTFAWAMAGQVLIALAQPVVMSAVSKVAGEYLEQEQRALGIAVGSAGGFAGMPLALLLGPLIGGSRLELLLAIEGIAGALAALALMRALRHQPGRSAQSPAVRTGMVSSLWAQPTMRTLCALAFLGFGVFVALATWLQTLLHPDHVSETTAGALLVAMILTGVVGCAVLPALVSDRDWERGFLLLVVVVGAIGEVLFGAVHLIGIRFAIVMVMGVFLLPALPVILTAAERLAGPDLAGSACAIVWLAGNLGGLVVAVIVQVLVHHPLEAFLTMAFIFLCGAPFALRLESRGALEVAQLGA
jgi:predicted MFS family arabinose efflux permease